MLLGVFHWPTGLSSVTNIKKATEGLLPDQNWIALLDMVNLSPSFPLGAIVLVLQIHRFSPFFLPVFASGAVTKTFVTAMTGAWVNSYIVWHYGIPGQSTVH